MTSPVPLQPAGQTILITGGSGFIGTALAERLAPQNRVVLFDRAFEGTPYSYSELPRLPSVETITGDVMDSAALTAAVHRANMVIHLAAVVGVRTVIRRARDTINTNFIGTSNLLRATETHPGLDRVVYFSTSEVFGANSFRVNEQTFSSIGAVSEARWSYSISKLAGEHLVHCYHRELNLPTVTIRPFNVFGPRRLGDHAMLRFIANALRGDTIEVHGDGAQIRSWCYIDDFCDGVLRTLVCDDAIGEDFNLGNTANTLTIYELAKKVRALLNSKSDIRFVEVDFSDIDIRVPRTDKARDLLGFRPRYELEEAIPLTAAWYREHLYAVAGDA